MTGWDHKFAVSFINEGLFRVTDPGPLRAPIVGFSLRRDDALELILETKTASDAKSTAPEHPSGTLRINTECASLENVGGVKVKLAGVLPYRVQTLVNHKPGRASTSKKQKYMSSKPQCGATWKRATSLTGLKTCRCTHSTGRIP
jgi:hypothetical protein